MSKINLNENRIKNIDGGTIFKDIGNWFNKKIITPIKNFTGFASDATEILNDIRQKNKDLYDKIIDTIESQGIAKTAENVKKIASALGYNI